MARTIEEIKGAIEVNLQSNLNLSSSSVAEWRLWVDVVATVIYTFELILDNFKRKIEKQIEQVIPGTLQWYVEMCYRFQNGHELSFDEESAQLFYKIDDYLSRIIAVASVSEANGTILFRVAKKQDNDIVPLSLNELHNFKNYINAIKFAGVKTNVLSSTEDKIKYNIAVHYNPILPLTVINSRCEEALNQFKTNLDFGAVIYSQRLVDSLMRIDGVATVELISLERKAATDDIYQPVGVSSVLDAGYFNYDDESVIEFISIRE